MDANSAVKAVSALAHLHRLTVFRMLVREGLSGLPAGEIAARLEIADDGVGLKADWRGGKGPIGIRLIEMMVRQVEGEVEFLARPGGGTRVVVRWPLA